MWVVSSYSQTSADFQKLQRVHYGKTVCVCVQYEITSIVVMWISLVSLVLCNNYCQLLVEF